MVTYQTKSWWKILLRWRGSVLPGVIGRVLLAGALGTLAAWLNQERGVAMPALAHGLVGVALGLLLVFRTNASYDRFWEGRRMLGNLVNRTRDFARQVTTLIDGDGDDVRAARERLVRRLNLLYALIRQYLRKERDLAALGALATAEERAALEPVAVRPTVAFTWMSAELVALARAGHLSEQRLMLLDANLTNFADAWGGAERIMKTPIPFAYAHHIKAFLMLFVFTAPFAMAASMHWETPAAAAVLAYGLFGIDEIAVEIEDPFGYDDNDLPLDAVGEVIAKDSADIARSSLLR